ncbi:MAG: CDP-alcohol phosphatidyltransferase family protein [Proteobacteria bacterium]|nr:CDP-alcohol phosphatidyltransferase family protein [Pseudomonadota bacterium]MCZ6784449.1 CDP-alcohol phosphatidyltransferase family protein [Pseudomonadota bacterium]
MTTSTMARGRWLTWANGLTGLRLFAAPVCACAILAGAPHAAGWIFALAVASDFADGRLARRRGEASALGGLLDHATDATFVSLGLGALAYGGLVPALLPFLVAAAFLQYTLDSRALAGQPLRTSFLGRWNGVAYFVLLGIPVVRDFLGLGWPPPALVHGLGWLLVASTAASMCDRALALRRLRST